MRCMSTLGLAGLIASGVTSGGDPQRAASLYRQLQTVDEATVLKAARRILDPGREILTLHGPPAAVGAALAAAGLQAGETIR